MQDESVRRKEVWGVRRKEENSKGRDKEKKRELRRWE